ncbi:hypothetical protein [Paraburkholderia youngii]|uniref:hypothetical protein n=1 Tax=Paraburkholderia youngii TaxID=2782701 RepID=UPI003D23CC93
MKRSLLKQSLVVAAIISGMAAANTASAAGCLKGAAIGAIVGHAAGGHGVLGAIGGCAVGRHMAKKKEEEKARVAQQQAYGAHHAM